MSTNVQTPREERNRSGRDLDEAYGARGGARDEGIGAWEVKARYSCLNLDNGGMAGGVENNGDVSGSGGAIRFGTDF